MNPLIVSARFAAYVWYTKHFAASPPRRAAAFAKMNWPTFMPLAQDGLGRLLKKIAAKKSTALEKNTRFKPSVRKLKTLSAALRQESWPQTR
jgi:hypothetical protein